MKLQFLRRNSNKAYLDRWLWLPKKWINDELLRLSLLFGNEDSQLKGYEETEHHLLVPRHLFTPEEVKQKFGLTVVDLRGDPSMRYAELDSSIVLRDDPEYNPQKEIVTAAVEALQKSHGASLVVGCGKGKTVLGIEIAARLQVRTLVVVPTTTIMTQWQEEVSKALNIDAGIIRGNKFQWERDIVIVSIDTLVSRFLNWPSKFFSYWGLVIFDEEHTLAGSKRSIVAHMFNCMRLGLTATFSREDGRQMYYLYHVGPVCYELVEQRQRPKTFYHYTTVKPPLIDPAGSIRQLPEESHDRSGNFNYSLLCKWLDRQPERHRQILLLIRKDLQEGRKLLVLCKTKAYAEKLAEEFEVGYGVFIHHNVKDVDRVNLIRNSRVAFCTEKIGYQAVNDPYLDTLYIIHPFKSMVMIPQSFGRLQREQKGKHELVVRVIEDKNVWPVHAICRKARKRVKELGYEYTLVPPKR